MPQNFRNFISALGQVDILKSYLTLLQLSYLTTTMTIAGSASGLGSLVCHRELGTVMFGVGAIVSTALAFLSNTAGMNKSFDITQLKAEIHDKRTTLGLKKVELKMELRFNRIEAALVQGAKVLNQPQQPTAQETQLNHEIATLNREIQTLEDDLAKLVNAWNH